MPNKLKQLWTEGRASLNGWLLIPNGLSAELMAKSGWDSVTVDLQHGLQDYRSMVECFQAMQAHPVVPMARVPWNEPSIIGKALDAGAYGIICPMTNTAEQVRAFVSCCKYPPQGTRSNGPVRAGIYAAAGGYQSTANREILCIPMVETTEALANLEAILDVPGVDAIYVGPTDLGFSLGIPPKVDHEDVQVLKIYERIIAESSKRGIAACMHCGAPNYAKRMIDMGFKMVTVGWDTLYLTTGARSAVAAVRDTQ
jgi:4-hydroxy-2-oxoheptanedioate aldolase